ncbi:endoglucanase A-like [Daktulosphaira vitifoliae]|uniref:endoglucanase A-like n=1 Tax=Daktulosphaira vitifoliae TaxID=58002 RepID=UPI0021A9B6C9|nr:endoglucanase A-like [Daktulosphaira vitifoliae]XP_050549211.1 endoglucanase A-like [Daktulosphaira vitifoliae]
MKITILTLLFVVANFTVYCYDYDEVLRLSLMFYEAQRSGHLPPDNRIAWRIDSATSDRGQAGEDLSGGYYDAGDYVKFGFTMASTTTILAWSCLSYKDAYHDANEWEHVLSSIRWAAEYFIKCHVSDYEFYGQVGDFNLDHSFWGRPEDMNMSRPAYKIDKDHPGSDLAGETSAALSAVSMVFVHIDPDFSAECLKHARQLYKFGTQYRGLYNDAIKGAAQYYESTDYGDELTWAALWLYKATKESQYLEDAEYLYVKYRLKGRPNEFFYNKKVAGVQMLLAESTNQQEYIESVQNFCDFNIYSQKKTPKGLLYIDKSGTLCHAANIAFLCLQASNYGIGSLNYIEFAKQQIHYMLGHSGRSYVIGFGKDYPTQPYHAASSCPDRPAPCDWNAYRSTKPNPQILYGALVSGPDENDNYKDMREEYIYNEVTLDYNAGFQSAVAGLKHLELMEKNRRLKAANQAGWDAVHVVTRT